MQNYKNRQKNQLSKQRTYGPETPQHHLPLFAVEMAELGISLSFEQWLDSSQKEYCSLKEDLLGGTTLVCLRKSSHSSFWLLLSKALLFCFSLNLMTCKTYLAAPAQEYLPVL